MCRHTDNDVFDDFPKISDYFPKISEDSSKIVGEATWAFQDIFRKFPKISKHSQI